MTRTYLNDIILVDSRRSSESCSAVLVIGGNMAKKNSKSETAVENGSKKWPATKLEPSYDVGNDMPKD